MKLAIIGAGWVGITTGAAFASYGHDVVCVDVNEERIALLNAGKLPFFESGLAELVAEMRTTGKLTFSLDVASAIRDANVTICAVGTPESADGAADVSAVFAVAETFGDTIERPSLFIVKSTVPPGTCAACEKIIEAELARRNVDVPFAVASNPEFLAEGTALNDALRPERIIVGCSWPPSCVDASRRREASTPAWNPELVICELYKPMTDAGIPLVYSQNAETAEVTKYAANAFLATKISFINEIANFCEVVGADAQLVARGMGLDSRIGPKFLRPGVGYGGSCFPKDLRALIHAGKNVGVPFAILPAVDNVNLRQRERLYAKLANALGDVRGKRVALWGLSYKPGTDDVRESPAKYFIERLLREGASVAAHDPMANNAMRTHFGDVEYVDDPLAALDRAHACVVLTEWPAFSAIPREVIIARLGHDIILYGR